MILRTEEENETGLCADLHMGKDPASLNHEVLEDQHQISVNSLLVQANKAKEWIHTKL